MELQTGRRKSRITSLPLGNPEEVVSSVEKTVWKFLTFDTTGWPHTFSHFPPASFYDCIFLFFSCSDNEEPGKWGRTWRRFSVCPLCRLVSEQEHVSQASLIINISSIFTVVVLSDLAVRFKRKRYVFRMCFFMLFDFCHEWIFHLSDNTLEETTGRPSRDISVCCVCSLLTFYSFTFH